MRRRKTQEDEGQTQTETGPKTHAGNNRHGFTQADSDKRKRIQTDKHRQHTCRSRLEASCLVKLAHTADPSMLPYKQSTFNALIKEQKGGHGARLTGAMGGARVHGEGGNGGRAAEVGVLGIQHASASPVPARMDTTEHGCLLAAVEVHVQRPSSWLECRPRR